MQAAAHGRSTLGIPKKVGEEFVGSDANGGGIVAGTVHVAPDGHVLLLRRAPTEKNFPNHWSLPGGNGDAGENAEEAADRENDEELGNTSPQGPKKLMDKRSTPTGKTFHTFAKPVNEKFWPKLNEEHTGAGWFGLHELPSPIHPAVKERLGADLGVTDGMDDPDDWAALHRNFAAWARAPEGQAQDEQLVIDLDDDENQLKRLLAHLQETSSIGHSFDVVVDPGDADHEKKFYIDGDGAFRIRGIKSDGKKLRHAQDQVQATTAGNSGFPPIVGKKAKHAQDGVCEACGGAGKVHGDMCAACGGSGVASTINAPMKPAAGALDALLAQLGGDEGFSEADHPRQDDGKFGSGGGKTVKSTSKSGGSTSKSAESSKPALKMGEMTKKGGQLGSNQGGLYEDSEGSKFYVKKPGSKVHVKNERTAAALYGLAGAKTLGYRDVEGGEHVATEWQKLEKKNIADFSPAERKEAAQDFAIHAWLSNWDAAGTGGDNQGVLNGKTTTLDVGGALRFRAQGGPKGDSFGDKVIEWETMRDKGKSPDAARLFSPMTEGELRTSVERVASIPDDKIRSTVGDDKELADRLIARKKDLVKKAGLAMDEMMLALDRAPVGLMIDRHGLAFDYAAPSKGSVRSESPDGHLHVEVSNISKAAVNPYRGDEIPGGKALGLVPDKIYYLFRDPKELKKAVDTFNNKPLLDEHVPVNAADHKPEHVIGATGSDAEFDGTYLKNSLVIWADKGINAVKSEKKKELSSAYRYRADMTPGTWNGTSYDGVMRDIVANHVALVEDGRAGPDVVVGDSKNPLIPKEMFEMTKRTLMSSTASIAYGALMAHLQPMLAMDKSIDLTKGLQKLNARNWKAKRPVLSAYVQELVKGKLQPKFAQDASIKEGLDAVLDMIEGGMPKAEDEFPPKKAEDEDKNEEEEDNESDGAEDEDDEDKEDGAEDGDPDDEEKKKLEFSKDKKAKDKKPSAGARDKKAKDEDVKGKEDKKAMDAAIDTRVQDAVKKERALQQAIYAAKDHVRSRVGELASMAFDSVEGVYLHAIKAAGKDTKPLDGVKSEALKFMFDNLPSPDSGKRQTTMAQDSAGGAAGSKADFTKRLPGVAKNLDRIGSA